GNVTSTPTQGGATQTPTPTLTVAATATPTLIATPTITRTLTATTLASFTPTATWTPAGSPTATPTLGGSASLALSPSATSVAVGQNFTVNVQVTTSNTCRGVQFGFTYDAAVLKLNSVDEGDFLTTWANSNGASTDVLPTWDIDN